MRQSVKPRVRLVMSFRTKNLKPKGALRLAQEKRQRFETAVGSLENEGCAVQVAKAFLRRYRVSRVGKHLDDVIAFVLP